MYCRTRILKKGVRENSILYEGLRKLCPGVFSPPFFKVTSRNSSWQKLHILQTSKMVRDINLECVMSFLVCTPVAILQG